MNIPCSTQKNIGGGVFVKTDDIILKNVDMEVSNSIVASYSQGWMRDNFPMVIVRTEDGKSKNR